MKVGGESRACTVLSSLYDNLVITIIISENNLKYERVAARST